MPLGAQPRAPAFPPPELGAPGAPAFRPFASDQLLSFNPSTLMRQTGNPMTDAQLMSELEKLQSQSATLGIATGHTALTTAALLNDSNSHTVQGDESSPLSTSLNEQILDGSPRTRRRAASGRMNSKADFSTSLSGLTPLLIPTSTGAIDGAIMQDGPVTAHSFNTNSPATTGSQQSMYPSPLDSNTPVHIPLGPGSAQRGTAVLLRRTSTFSNSSMGGFRRKGSTTSLNTIPDRDRNFDRRPSATSSPIPTDGGGSSNSIPVTPTSTSPALRVQMASTSLPQLCNSPRLPAPPSHAGKVAIPVACAPKSIEPVLTPEERARKLEDELRKIDFEDVTVANLKDLLRTRGLSIAGRKADLVDRLKEQIKLNQLRSESITDSTQSTKSATHPSQRPIASVSPAPSIGTITSEQEPSVSSDQGTPATRPDTPVSPSSVYPPLTALGSSVHSKRGGGASPVVAAPRIRTRTTGDSRYSRHSAVSSALSSPISRTPSFVDSSNFSMLEPYTQQVLPAGHFGRAAPTSLPLFSGYFPDAATIQSGFANSGILLHSPLPVDNSGKMNFFPSEQIAMPAPPAEYPFLQMQVQQLHGPPLLNGQHALPLWPSDFSMSQGNGFSMDSVVHYSNSGPLSASVHELTLGLEDLGIPSDNPLPMDFTFP
ncbi:hypothetical protein DFJ73DRAFT_328434 [Zopfochytrium polystomum]|nr:hypothetical protein DFJ73DRAFT_328434 [Zopfochytrium polystomum]